MKKQEILDLDVLSLKDLKQIIKDVRSELDGCTINSDEFEDALQRLTEAQDALKNATKKSNGVLEGSYDALTKKMAELKKEWRAVADEADRNRLGEQIADINNQLKDMDASIGSYSRNVGNYGSAFDNVTMKIEGGVAKFEKFNNVSRSIIGSFDLVEGGLKAIGVESEEVEGLMRTMQGAMMFTNGLNSVKEGVQAFTTLRTSVTAATAAQTALNAAQMANPIGLIVVAVAALVAGITKLVSVIRKNRDEEEKLKQSYEATNKVVEDRIAAQEFEIELMKAKGIAQDEILKKEREFALINAENTKERIAAIEEELENTKGLRRKKKKILEEQLQDLKDQLKDQETAIKNANNTIIIYDTQCETERTAARQDAMVERARIAKAEADAEIAEAERARKAIMDDFKADMETREEYWMNEMQREEKRLKDEANRQRQNLYKARQEGLINPEKYREEWNEISKILDLELEKLQEKYVNVDSTGGIPFFPKPEETEKQFDTFGAKLKDTLNLSEKQLKGVSAGVNLLGTSLGQTSQLLTTLANAQDQNTEEGFELAKKYNIAAAVMQMLNGVVSAWTSAMQLGPIAGPIMGGVLTAFTTSLGMININKIKSTTFNNPDGAVGGSTTLPNINTAALISSPVSYTTEVKGAKAEEEIPQRVYVVETDIVETMNKVNVAEDESVY